MRRGGKVKQTDKENDQGEREGESQERHSEEKQTHVGVC